MKKTIRLTESDLHRVIRESVKRVISEAPYKHFKENQYEKATKIEWLLNDVKEKLVKLKSLYDDAYPDEFDRRIQDVNSFACDALKLMDNYGFPDFNSDDYYVEESTDKGVSDVESLRNDPRRERELTDYDLGMEHTPFGSFKVKKWNLKESDYDDYFDWAEKSGASSEEINSAGERHDDRLKGNSFHGDKLAYKQHRYKQFDDRGEDSINKSALKKRTTKRLRDGWRF